MHLVPKGQQLQEQAVPQEVPQSVPQEQQIQGLQEAPVGYVLLVRQGEQYVPGKLEPQAQLELVVSTA